MRLSEEDLGPSGVDPGGQENASGQWRDRLRERAPRRELPEEATASTRLSDQQRSPLAIESDHHPEENRSGSPPSQAQPGLVPDRPRKGRGQPWTFEEKQEFMWCYYSCLERGNPDYRNVYRLWRDRNPNNRPNLNANTLQTQRRNTERNLTETEKNRILQDIRHEVDEQPNINTEEVNEVSNQVDEQADGNEGEERELRQKIQTKIGEVENLDFAERNFLQKIRKDEEVKDLIDKANTVLETILTTESNLTSINNAIYATACVVTNEVLLKRKERDHGLKEQKTMKKRPPWEYRIDRKIQALRKDLSLLIEYNRTENSSRKYRDVLRKWAVGDGKSLNEAIEELKQRVSATAQRLRRYKRRSRQFRENLLFQNDTKKFYQSIRENIKPDNLPSQEAIESFWKNIYEQPADYNEEAHWITKIEGEEIPEMEWPEITSIDVKEAIDRTHNWKAAGPDKVPNFWLKELTTTHKHLAKEYSKLIITQDIPLWLGKGRTILIAKNKEPQDPKNYRPITCLNTIYKNLTSISANRISKHVNQHNLIPLEQKGCCQGSRGCKDQLLISKTIADQCQKEKKSLSTGWIDYKKAYDSVPHPWILKSLKLVGVNNNFITFCQALMRTWRVIIHLNGDKEKITTSEVKIAKGIYQGDSLSPLLFCIALFPLSRMLNDTGAGYKLKNGATISHLLYMDDLKLFAKSKIQLRKLIDTTVEFSHDIRMQFGVDKCAVVSVKGGKIDEMNNVQLGEEEYIQTLGENNSYKYLGVDESLGPNHEGTKEKVKKEYYHRLRKILRTQLNAKNKLTAIGSLALPVIQYSFGIINWRVEEIRQLDKKTRKLLTMHGMLHPRADVSRLYLARKLGGRGLKQIEASYENEIFSLVEYMNSMKEQNLFLQETLTYDKNLRFYSLTKHAIKTANSLKENSEPLVTLENLPNRARIKAKIKQRFKDNWKVKPMHGQILREMEEQPTDLETSFAWLRRGILKPESESLITAAQEQALRTRYIEKNIMHIRTDDKCRLCKERSETVVHLMSACGVLARKEYIDRHNQVCSLIHYQLCLYFNCNPKTKNWYTHTPEKVTVSMDGNVTLLYDHPIRTDRTMTAQDYQSGPANRPDIVIKTNRETYLIDVAIPSDNNIIRKEAEKRLKYRGLAIELQRMWKTKVTIIPIVIGSTGFVSKEYCQLVKKIPGKHTPEDLQKTAVLGTAHILRKVLA